MAPPDQALRAVLRRLRARAALAAALPALGVGVASGAGLALVARRLEGWSAAEAVPLLGLGLAAGGLALLRVRWADRAQAARWLDQALGGGGWVVAWAERPDPDWEGRVPAVAALPAWGLRREGLGALGSLAFAALALGVPLSAAPPAPDAVAKAEQAALEQTLATLEAEVEVPEAQLDAWEAQIAAMDGMQAEAALDASDALQAAMAEAAADAQSLGAEALQGLDAAASGDSAGAAAAAEALSGEGAPKLPPDLQRRLAQAGQEGGLDAASAQELRDALAEALAEDASKLREVQLLQQGEGQGSAGEEGAEGAEGADGAEGAESGSSPGQGGVTQGGGPAPLTFGEAAPQARVFQDQALPDARYQDPASQQVGEGTRRPEANAAIEAGGSGAAGTDPGSSRGRSTLTPRHRAAVQRYFTPTR